ncbi:MAG TPA: helix-turn-helix transcriptional regulator [Candidatus Acidoferrales bacterium]|nr:helix-turn-helix transcriptional regulator [Candidatus Acidoferrales bacterium]
MAKYKSSIVAFDPAIEKSIARTYDDLSQDDVVGLLVHAKGGDSIEVLAARVGVSFQYLARVLTGERSPGPKVLKFLGAKKVVAYRLVVNKEKK